jgi:hypothetical protein
MNDTSNPIDTRFGALLPFKFCPPEPQSGLFLEAAKWRARWSGASARLDDDTFNSNADDS